MNAFIKRRNTPVEQTETGQVLLANPFCVIEFCDLLVGTSKATLVDRFGDAVDGVELILNQVDRLHRSGALVATTKRSVGALQVKYTLVLNKETLVAHSSVEDIATRNKQFLSGHEISSTEAVQEHIESRTKHALDVSRSVPRGFRVLTLDQDTGIAHESMVDCVNVDGAVTWFVNGNDLDLAEYTAFIAGTYTQNWI